ncbi:MAG: carboxylesterase family protein [Planctomycetota bacterium]
MTPRRATTRPPGERAPRRGRAGGAALLALALLGSAAAAQEPLKKLPSDARKTIRKAVDGDEKALAKLQALGPLTRKAAEETQKKVLAAWPFRSLKSGRSKVELEFEGTKREYALYAPKGYNRRRSWPLILSLHGAGGNGPMEINFQWGRNLAKWKGFVVAPSGRPPGDQWFPGQEKFVLAVLRDVCRKANIDANRIYCNGFSNGGNGAWYYAEVHPGTFAAMCTRGGGNPRSDLLQNLFRVPTYIVHGELDQVIEVTHDRRDAAKLKEMGYEVVYTEVKGGGHKPFNEENEKILAFFRKHPRDPHARRLRLRVPGSGSFRNLWLEIPEGAGHNAEAEVRKNEIDITGTSRAVLWLSDGLVDLDAEVVVRLDGEEAFRGLVPRKLGDLVADLQARFDRTAPAFARLEVPPR